MLNLIRVRLGRRDRSRTLGPARKVKSCAGITRWVYSVEPLGNQNRNAVSGDEA
jgi:hypothetical protein